MKTKAVFSLLLAALALTSVMVSCGDATGETVETQKPAAETSDLTAETEETLKSLVPDGLDFGGEEIRILSSSYFETDTFMMHVDEATGDVVNDAVYNRNLALESKFNVKFTYQDEYLNGSGIDSATQIRKFVTAGSDDYDIIFGCQYNLAPLVLDNIMLNLDGEEYLHLDQPWWYQNHIQEMSIGHGKTYFVTGDITLGVLRNMGCMYVNKQLYTQIYECVDDMYQEFLDG